ncbi:MAG: DNA internalization-related competence protein ComEC/Rec2 [Lachnospiraceae bacterium]|nr:DNA internalization-related competence protein ComEC/Rec2 [Lachnospiraceae bacterium]
MRILGKMPALRIRRPMCLFSLVFVLITCLLTIASDPADKVTRFCDTVGKNTTLTVTGTVTKIEYKNGNTVLTVSDVDYETGKQLKSRPDCGRLVIYPNEDAPVSVKIGSTVKLKGSFVPYDRAFNTGNYDALKYNSLRGIYGKITGAEIIAVSAEYSWLKHNLFELKEATKRVYEHYLSQDEAGTLSALVLGDRTELSDEIKTAYQNASISHILSLSGLHIATIGLMLLRLLKKCGLNTFAASVTASAVMICYALMTGMSVSTVRALIMFLLGLIAQLLNRTYDLISAAALSAVVILVTEPYYLYDTGFLLSFSAVMGINYVYPSVRKIMRKMTSNMRLQESPVTIPARALCFSLSIQLATLPVTMYSFSQITLSGIFVNLIVIPLMTILLSSGIVLAFAGNLALMAAGPGVAQMIFDLISKLAALSVHLILSCYGRLTLISSLIPHNVWICGQPSILQAAIYYVMLTGLIIYAETNLNDRRRVTARKHPLNADMHLPRKCLITFCLAILILSFRARAGIEFHAVSVGQGDCTLICGYETPTILIDGGSSDIKNVGKYRIVPCLKAHAVSHIDLLFISHFDSDHVNGIIEMLEDDNNVIGVDKIIISECVPLMEHNDNYTALKNAAAKKHIPILLMDAGDIISTGGTFTGKRVQITALSPSANGSSTWKTRDINDNSLVVRYSCDSGFTALFTGDISSDVEKDLMQTGHISYLKCAHHGSKTASSYDFIKMISPKIATISCGIDNSYGHPHRETLETLNKMKTKIYTTDTMGEITVKLKKGGSSLSVTAYLSKDED